MTIINANAPRLRDGRRRALQSIAGGALVAATHLTISVAQAQTSATINIGTTPVFLDDQLGFLDAWRRYLEAATGRKISFVQRSNYREITELLLAGRIDCAWLCGYPYVKYRERLRLVVTPSFRGVPTYESYLIVPASDTATKDFAAMRGHAFAYSDPLSNSGYLAPRYTLWAAGFDPDQHFSRTFFTWSHKKVVQAVAVGLAQGGSVDGYVWETLAKTQPELTRRTRVAWKSPSYGFPPVVASASGDGATIDAVRAALLGMQADAEGKALLARLNLDAFVASDDHGFDSIAVMLAKLTGAGKIG